jgi:hypothetical protein
MTRTSDKVGLVAAIVIAIVVTILVLWPGLWSKKSTTTTTTIGGKGALGQGTGNKGAGAGARPGGVSAAGAAPPPPAAPAGAVSSDGTNALGSTVINGKPPAAVVQTQVKEPRPKVVQGTIIRTIDDGSDDVVII